MEVGQLALGKNDTPLGEGIINNQAKGGNNMEGNQGRRMSAEEKLKIVVEGRQSGATVSEVCRRHQIAHTQFYRWERMAREGALEMLCSGARKAKNGKREEWLIAEINQLRTVVAEVTLENLTLKKGGLV
jgi:transposase-like protein